MPKIAIVTDTDSSLPFDLAEQHGIIQVPISVQFGTESFDACFDINDAQTFARIDREGKLPTTAAPIPGKFVAAYEQAFERGAETVVCLCVSSEVSATYASALQAAELLPGRDINVVDSRAISMSQGFMALAAASSAEAGANKEQVVAAAQEVLPRTSLYGALSTLKYLAMSGRVGYLAAGLATLLDVKPLLTMRNGKLEMLEKVRARSKSWARVVELAVEAAGGKPVERMAMIHVNALAGAKQLEGMLREKLTCPKDIIYGELTPGLSVHSGAGMVGVVLVAGK
jgi:DegV family protein with EDD domain